MVYRGVRSPCGHYPTVSQLALRLQLLFNVCPGMGQHQTSQRIRRVASRPSALDTARQDRRASPPASDINELPMFTIEEASRQTGVAAATLRAWERRYAVPSPQRTSGGFRVYARRDILEIRGIVRRCAKGLSPRQAAFFVLRERITGRRLAEPGDLPGMRRRLEEACLTFDDEATAAVLEQASVAYPGTGVLRDLVLPVVATIAAGHHAGAITISQEHFASQLARRVGADLLAAAIPASTRVAVLLACAPGEQHELGLLLLACELGQRGFRVTYLGPAVPVDSFLAAAERLDAPVCVVGATIPAHLEEWRTHLRRLPRRRPAIIWAGPAASMAARWPGSIARDVDEGIDRVLRLSVGSRRMKTLVKRPDNAKRVKARVSDSL